MCFLLSLLLLLQHHLLFHPSRPIYMKYWTNTWTLPPLQWMNPQSTATKECITPSFAKISRTVVQQLDFRKCSVLLIQVVRRVRRWSRCPFFVNLQVFLCPVFVQLWKRWKGFSTCVSLGDLKIWIWNNHDTDCFNLNIFPSSQGHIKCSQKKHILLPTSTIYRNISISPTISTGWNL